jgi:Calcium-activated chloride channel
MRRRVSRPPRVSTGRVSVSSTTSTPTVAGAASNGSRRHRKAVRGLPFSVSSTLSDSDVSDNASQTPRTPHTPDGITRHTSSSSRRSRSPRSNRSTATTSSRVSAPASRAATSASAGVGAASSVKTSLGSRRRGRHGNSDVDDGTDEYELALQWKVPMVDGSNAHLDVLEYFVKQVQAGAYPLHVVLFHSDTISTSDTSSAVAATAVAAGAVDDDTAMGQYEVSDSSAPVTPRTPFTPRTPRAEQHSTQGSLSDDDDDDTKHDTTSSTTLDRRTTPRAWDVRHWKVPWTRYHTAVMLITAPIESIEQRARLLNLHLTNDNELLSRSSSRLERHCKAKHQLYTPSERLQIVASILETVTHDRHFIDTLPSSLQDVVRREGEYLQSLGLLRACRRLHLVQDVIPLHAAERRTTQTLTLTRRTIWNEMIPWRSGCASANSSLLLGPTNTSVLTAFVQYPVHAFRSYFGEKVALYFAWMQCYNQWLFIPGILGIATHILSRGRVDETPYAPVFGLFVCIWASLFLKFWTRQSAHVALEWNVLDSLQQLQSSADDEEDFDDDMAAADVRAEFRGELAPSPVTGKMRKYYPKCYRYPKYAVSAAVTLIMLSIAILVMFMSLNLQGYIRPADGVVYVHALSRFATKGAIFSNHFRPDGFLMLQSDSHWLGGYGWLVPIILHSLVVFALNKCYQVIAIQLNDWENHRTHTQYENALIVKRFLFEALDCYLPLFYIAFYQLSARSLRENLAGLFTADEVRRLFMESLIPYAWTRISRTVHLMSRSRWKHSSLKAVSKQFLLPPYDQFDDYLEMCIQFGYVTLFASAFPLAATLAMLSNIVEARSDAFKLLFTYRRPTSQRVRSIGAWFTVLRFLSVLAIVTNCFIFGFSSAQMSSVFHWTGVTGTAVSTVFAFEHVLMLICFVIYAAIPDVPSDVSITMRQRAYKKVLIERIHKKRLARHASTSRR